MPGPSRVCGWRVICDWRSSATNSSFIINRSLRSKVAVSPGLRRWCAGHIRSEGWLHQASSFLSPAYRSLSLSVNLSSRQVSQPDLIERIKGVLDESGIDPHCLKLEITESVVMENAEAATLMFKQLRGLGVQLSIDDFGTGYSSLSYLHRFPVNYLKIDQSFVGRMTEANDNAEIVRTIVTLARNLGLEVVAEGIETQSQNRQLKALGCDYGQGYLFSRPIDSASVPALLARALQDDVSFEFDVPAFETALLNTAYEM